MRGMEAAMHWFVWFVIAGMGTFLAVLGAATAITRNR